MNDGPIARAFLAAGYKSPDEKLMEIAVDAWGKWPGSDGGGARRDFVRGRLVGEMSWALFAAWQPDAHVQAIGLLLNRAKLAIEDARPTRPARDTGPSSVGGGGQHEVDTQLPRAPASTPSTERAGPVVRSGSELARPTPAPSSIALARSTLTAMADRQAAATTARIATEIRLSRLDSVMVDGKPIGDCVVIEVRNWAARRGRESREAGRDQRFAMHLVSGLPGNALIRAYHQDIDEVEKFYQSAEAEHAA